MKLNKFQVWDKFKKQWLDGFEVIFKYIEGYTIYAIPNSQAYAYDECHTQGLDYLQNRFKIISYSGLKDSNGIEIYEGDMVFDGTRILVCKWNRRRAEFAWYSIYGDYIYPIGDLRTNISRVGSTYETDVYKRLKEIYE